MPGIVHSSRLARVTIRRSSGCEVPGAVIQCNETASGSKNDPVTLCRESTGTTASTLMRV